MGAKRFEVLFTQVASGFQVGDFQVQGGTLFGLWCPIVDSCAITLRGSFDQTSANYLPVQQSGGSLDWTFSAGPGSKAISLQDTAFPFPFLRLFTSVAQTLPRTFAIVNKFG